MKCDGIRCQDLADHTVRAPLPNGSTEARNEEILEIKTASYRTFTNSKFAFEVLVCQLTCKCPVFGIRLKSGK